MKTDVIVWSSRAGWSAVRDDLHAAQLVFYFGARSAIDTGERFAELKDRFPRAHVIGCSTGGQIYGGDVSDDTVAAVAMSFAMARVEATEVVIKDVRDSFCVGQTVGATLARPDLRSTFVLSDGILVNGSALVEGIKSRIGSDVVLTGGLAGDGIDFKTTLVGADAPPRPGRVAAVGFYGATISIGHGSAGGWSEFGPTRLITRSESNVLYELDGKPALDLYERYLGPDAENLPSSALLYPLMIKDSNRPGHSVVRTILAVDRDKRTMTFAGDVPQGYTAQLMRGHFDRLADGAGEAGRQAAIALGKPGSESAAILVSCIGRRLLMGQGISDEILAAQEMLGMETKCVGFYSYGEISPHGESGMCELHNQTMTVTTISEAL